MKYTEELAAPRDLAMLLNCDDFMEYLDITSGMADISDAKRGLFSILRSKPYAFIDRGNGLVHPKRGIHVLLALSSASCRLKLFAPRPN